MPQHIFRQVYTAFSNLNPHDVRALSEQRVTIGLHRSTPEGLEAMERFFCPEDLSRERRLEILNHLFAAGDTAAPPQFDLEIFQQGMPHTKEAFVIPLDKQARVRQDILEARDN